MTTSLLDIHSLTLIEVDKFICCHQGRSHEYLNNLGLYIYIYIYIGVYIYIYKRVFYALISMSLSMILLRIIFL